MSCERTRALLIDAWVNGLDHLELQVLKEHLESCTECAAESVSLQQLWSALDIVTSPAPDPGGLSRLMTAVNREFGEQIRQPDRIPGKSPGKPHWFTRIAFASVFLALGAVLTITVFIRQDTADSPAVVETANSRFLLVMSETTEPPEQSERADTEIQEWFAQLVESGVMETGFGLADIPLDDRIGDGVLMDEHVMGLIVIFADDMHEARQIVSTSPILTWGGAIEIRELD